MKRHTFVLECRQCGARFFIQRKRRVLGWFPVDAYAHAPGCDRATRHLRVLHYDERRAALRAMGRA